MATLHAPNTLPRQVTEVCEQAGPKQIDNDWGLLSKSRPFAHFGRFKVTHRVRLWAPKLDQLHGLLHESVANCLAEAFSSREWTHTPMPVDDSSDSHSAYRIIAELGKQARVFIASTQSDNETSEQVLACVLGGILNELIIDTYGLAPYGARTGDGLLAYIGLRPAVQGSCALFQQDDIYELRHNQSSTRIKEAGDSLASLLFTKWLEQPAIKSCPHVFIRTREVLAPILHLAAKHRFEFCGKFYLDFRGEKQDRMIFKRSH